MLVLNHTCKHCGVIYLYHASGPGCHEPNNNEDYCPECMQAINAALNKIPQKAKGVYKEFKPKDELIQKLKAIKEKQLQKEIDNPFAGISFRRYFYDIYENVETYYDERGFSYKIKWNDENDLHFFKLIEYDCINNKETDKLYVNYNKGEFTTNYYILEHPCKPKFLSEELVPVTPMAPPLGKVFWMEPKLEGTCKELN